VATAVGPDVLLDPPRNKGTVFSETERTALGLPGIGATVVMDGGFTSL
jgi:hypothetical protein